MQSMQQKGAPAGRKLQSGFDEHEAYRYRDMSHSECTSQWYRFFKGTLLLGGFHI